MGYQLVHPPHSRSAFPSTKRTKLCHNTQVPQWKPTLQQCKKASSKFPAQEADELRSDVNQLLKQHHTQCKNHWNINPTQCRALPQLKQDTSRVVLTADKGVAMVIMDQQDYTNKANILLQDTNTYKVFKKDPTSSLKNQTNNSSQGHQKNKRPQQHQVQKTLSHQLQSPQNSSMTFQQNP